jgi:hypothetical protein
MLTVTTGTVVEIRGTYSSGSFTAGDSGTDVMLSWNSSNSTATDQSIILVGTGATADTITDGILTIA